MARRTCSVSLRSGRRRGPPRYCWRADSLGIDTTIIHQVPTGALDYAQAYSQGLIGSPTNPTRQDIGALSNLNGIGNEAQTAADVLVTGANYIENQRFLPNNGIGVNTQIDGIRVQNSWWNGTTNTQIETTIGTKSGSPNGAIFDSLNMPVEINIARQYGLAGQISENGNSGTGAIFPKFRRAPKND